VSPRHQSTVGECLPVAAHERLVVIAASYRPIEGTKTLHLFAARLRSGARWAITAGMASGGLRGWISHVDDTSGPLWHVAVRTARVPL